MGLIGEGKPTLLIAQSMPLIVPIHTTEQTYFQVSNVWASTKHHVHHVRWALFPELFK